MEIPEQYGGSGVSDWRFNVVLGEEAVRAGVGDAMAGPLLHSDVCCPYLMASATDEQKARWLPAVPSGETVARDRDDRAGDRIGPGRDQDERAPDGDV